MPKKEAHRCHADHGGAAWQRALRQLRRAARRQSLHAGEVHHHCALEHFRLVLIQAYAEKHDAGAVHENIHFGNRGGNLVYILAALDIQTLIAEAVEIEIIVRRIRTRSGHSHFGIRITKRGGNRVTEPARTTSHQHRAPEKSKRILLQSMLMLTFPRARRCRMVHLVIVPNDSLRYGTRMPRIGVASYPDLPHIHRLKPPRKTRQHPMTHPSISQLFDLSGKTAIVTGAAQGIGLAIARRWRMREPRWYWLGTTRKPSRKMPRPSPPKAARRRGNAPIPATSANSMASSIRR